MLKGRVVRPGTPTWTQSDTALALALQRIEATKCSGCGQDRRASMNPDQEFSWRVEPLRCHACATRDRAAAAHAKQDGSSTAGLLWAVTRKEQEVDRG